MATLENIQAKIVKLQAEAEAIMKRQSSAVAKISELMETYGITLADLESHLGGRRRGRKPVISKLSSDAAKYLDPKTGATWSGRGRAPGRIADAKNRSKYLIGGSAQPQAHTAENANRAGNYVRGPQAPKYRDPETGATWSGRGRAPAWLADVEDRTSFLIRGNATAVPKVSSAKKVAVEKRSFGRAATKKAVPRTKRAKKVDVPTDLPN